MWGKRKILKENFLKIFYFLRLGNPSSRSYFFSFYKIAGNSRAENVPRKFE